MIGDDAPSSLLNTSMSAGYGSMTEIGFIKLLPHSRPNQLFSTAGLEDVFSAIAIAAVSLDLPFTWSSEMGAIPDIDQRLLEEEQLHFLSLASI